MVTISVSGSAFAWVASMAGAVAVWAQHRAELSEYQKLERRVRFRARLRGALRRWTRGVDSP